DLALTQPDTPRWSVNRHSVVASMTWLPESGSMVAVGPPLVPRAPSLGSTPSRERLALMVAEPVLCTRLWVTVKLPERSVSPYLLKLPATMLYRTDAVAPIA